MENVVRARFALLVCGVEPVIYPLRSCIIKMTVNPFTATGCKIFRAEWCTDAPANSIFSGPVTSIFSAMRFDENPFSQANAIKEDKKTEGFQISHFYGSFSSDMAVKGLKAVLLNITSILCTAV